MRFVRAALLVAFCCTTLSSYAVTFNFFIPKSGNTSNTSTATDGFGNYTFTHINTELQIIAQGYSDYDNVPVLMNITQPVGGPGGDGSANGPGIGVDAGGNPINQNKAEAILFQLPTGYRIESVRFSKFAVGEVAQFLDGSFNLIDELVRLPGENTTFTISGIFDSLLAFGAIPSGGTPNDNFFIRSITITAVPLPAALVLFLTGILGFGFVRRRQPGHLAI
jgi:hypothetical protein